MGHNDGNRAERDVRTSDVKSKPATGKKPSDKKTGAGKRTSNGKKNAPGRSASVRKKTASGKKASAVKRERSGGKAVQRRKPASAGKTSGKPAIANERIQEYEPRVSRRDEERARRRAERERKVRRQKIIMVVSLCVILLAVIGIVLFCLPSVKLAFRMFQGDRYAAKEEYAKAQSAYEQALTIDSSSVKAYRGLADLFAKQEMAGEAEQILNTGWEKTQDENLLQYYCVTVLNQAVAQINDGNVTLSTVEKCVRVLEKGGYEQKSLELLAICYDRLFKEMEENGTCMMFFDEDTSQDTCSFEEYEQLLRRMLTVYQANSSESIGLLLKQYAVIDVPYVRLSMPHLEPYLAVLTEISGVINDASLTETVNCLSRAREVREYFNTAFDEFAAENYAYARDLVSEDTYQKIRDSFIEENAGYWEGSVYIPVSREQLVIHREGENVRFFFLDDEEYENLHGIIIVWGTQQEDDGVQRSVVSYKPPKTSEADPHTEYIIQYLYSNVKINGKYVPQMNYRFDTKVTTPEGTTTNAIGDWGGENEWEIDY